MQRNLCHMSINIHKIPSIYSFNVLRSKREAETNTQNSK